MKKKKTKRESVNLFFSAFLMLAYIVCGYFFAQFAGSLGGEMLKTGVSLAILVIFGLLVFYATRVGEGKAIKRFSIITLILLDLPALFIVVAAILVAAPENTQLAQIPVFAQIAEAPIVVYMAAIALGYGIPYTFLSGFELEGQKDEVIEFEKGNTILEGGIEADLETEEEEEPVEEKVDEIVVEGVAADEEPEKETEE